MRKLIMLLLLTSTLVGVKASSLISGVIYDANSQLPVSLVTVTLKGSDIKVQSDRNGQYQIEVTNQKSILIFESKGYLKKEILVGPRQVLNVYLQSNVETVENEFVADEELQSSGMKAIRSGQELMSQSGPVHGFHKRSHFQEVPAVHNTEGYSIIHENGFKSVSNEPLSTFAADVDAASYSNIRRFLSSGQMPPKDAVRIEEMINYFSYDYKAPVGSTPFSINTELAKAPWNDQHMLVQVGLQAKKIPEADLPASNLVFLVDVSGSMQSPNKLPLLKASFKMLVNKLRAKDRVAIVVYAGAAGLVLPSTSGMERKQILEAIDNLSAGGSTAGGAGIHLAYRVASEAFIADGNNRIILASDGDFNVGQSSNASMERLITEKKKEGIFLTVLGYGMGNYKDDKMEVLADKGNGNYAYIDNISEARKVFVNEFGGTLFTVAKDVKIQIEFNPTKVAAYRLIGYENRALAKEDFNNDKKDGGEVGSGHNVTALYEVIPQGAKSAFMDSVDPLKYQSQQKRKKMAGSDEWLTVKVRYKEPEGEVSKLQSQVISGKPLKMSPSMQWSSIVASFGMLLRASDYKGNLDYAALAQKARQWEGPDPFGYKKEMVELVETARLLSGTITSSK